MYCWICSDVLFNEYYMIPRDDEVIQKSCSVIKREGCFKFIYNTVCENCLNMYLKNYPINYKKLLKREIYGNNFNKYK